MPASSFPRCSSSATVRMATAPNSSITFIDVLQGKAVAHMKPAESLAIQKILYAIYTSAKTGKEVRIQ